MAQRGRGRFFLFVVLMALLSGCGGARLPGATQGATATTLSHVPIATIMFQAAEQISIAQGDLRYSDPQGRYSFYRPSEWLSIPPSAARITAAFRSPALGGLFVISEETVAPGTTIDTYVGATLRSEAATLAGFTPLPLAQHPRPEHALGATSRMVDFLSQSAQGEQYHVQTIVLRDATAYLFERTLLANQEAYSAPFIGQAQIVFDTLSFA